MGTGSEVQIAVAARERLEADGVPTRVVSLPCVEWFAEQDQAYRERGAAAVGARPGERRGRRADGLARVRRRRRPDRRPHHYGASAAYTVLYEEFGLTDEAVVAAARESLAGRGVRPGRPGRPGRAAGGLPHPTGDR